jgi:hypothetical protein
LASSLAFPVWAANASDATKDGASNIDQPVQSNATQQAAPVTNDAAGGAKQGGAKQDSNAAAKARKQTPTAAMDSATPTEKSTTGKSAATKHPPTTEMDRAAPDQKSPGSTSSDTPPAAAAPASTTRN